MSKQTIESITQQIRESAPLPERLRDCRKRIATMCSGREGPKMSIPPHWDDDDMFICATIDEAIDKCTREA